MSDPVSAFADDIADDIEALLPKVAELFERGRKITELRARKGGRLGQASRDNLSKVADAVAELQDALEPLLLNDRCDEATADALRREVERYKRFQRDGGQWTR